MTHWPQQIAFALREGPCVLVTLNLIAGSSPRESGCRMIVSGEGTAGSIGGGNLEYTAIAQARTLLQESGTPRQVHQPFGLGPELNQCCGGAVTLLFEVLSGDCPDWVSAAARAWDDGDDVVLAQAIDGEPPARSIVGFRGMGDPPVPAVVRAAARSLLEQPVNTREPVPAELTSVEAEGGTWWLERLGSGLRPLYLFGAGHVGRELARLLERLPFRVRWIDSRPGVFPGQPGGHVEAVSRDDPAAEVARAAPGAVFVVMTHSHQLDEDICFEILRRGDFCWLGLIGSQTKRRRFVHRLAKRGVEAARLDRLVCPIGLGGIRGKQPATIALSVAAQLMEERPWIDAGT